MFVFLLKEMKVWDRWAALIAQVAIEFCRDSPLSCYFKNASWEISGESIVPRIEANDTQGLWTEEIVGPLQDLFKIAS